MSTTDLPSGDPAYPDPDALDGHAYHRVVGPALRAAAEVAAKRGHPTPHDDMPAMLALMGTIKRLAALYGARYPERLPAIEKLDSAAAGACVMVFTQAKMSAEAIAQCLAALEAAYDQIRERSLLDGARPSLAAAWSYLEDGQHEAAQPPLQSACEHMIAAIEAWRTQAH